MIEYCNQRFPGKSTTECYEYIKNLNFCHMLMHCNLCEQEANGKYAARKLVLFSHILGIIKLYLRYYL